MRVGSMDSSVASFGTCFGSFLVTFCRHAERLVWTVFIIISCLGAIQRIVYAAC